MLGKDILGTDFAKTYFGKTAPILTKPILEKLILEKPILQKLILENPILKIYLYMYLSIGRELLMPSGGTKLGQSLLSCLIKLVHQHRRKKQKVLKDGPKDSAAEFFAVCCGRTDEN